MKKEKSEVKRSPAEIKKKKRSSDEIESIFSEKKKQVKKEASETAIKQHARASAKKTAKKSSNQNESLLESNFGKSASVKWVDDGLGGKFNAEGYTGRVEEGVKVFKAHVLNKPNFGNTKDCPFDCDCCFI